MRRRLGHPLVVAAIVGLTVGLPIVALALLPTWEFRPLPVGTPGEWIQSVAWSPDGTRFVTQENGRYVIMGASDASVLLAVDGWSPVWVDDQTIDSLRDIGAMRSQVVSLDLRTGRASPMGGPLGISHFIADRDGHLAARSEIGDIVTKVLDPTDGHVIAALPGLRAQVWAGSGTLVSKTVDAERQAQGVLPGALVAWSAGRESRPIGANLLEFRDSVTVSPSGHAIACACGPIVDGTEAPPLAITIVPVDGSPATTLVPWVAPNPSMGPVAIWLDDRTLAFVDRAGLHRVSVDGVVEPLPGFDPSELSTKGSFATMAKVGDTLAILTHQGSGLTGTARLTVLEPDGSVAFRQTMPSWNGAYVVPDSTRRRALIVSDPQLSGEPPDRIFLLGQGAPPRARPFESLEPSLTPGSSPGTNSAGIGSLDRAVE